MIRARSRRRPSPAGLTTTVDGAVELSGLSRSSIYELIKRGSLESRLVNGRRLIVMASLRQLLELPAA
jgi:hypothetical protein